jgi:hypothetical protein
MAIAFGVWRRSVTRVAAYVRGGGHPGERARRQAARPRDVQRHPQLPVWQRQGRVRDGGRDMAGLRRRGHVARRRRPARVSL